MRNRSTFGCATASPGGVWRRCKCLTIPEHGLCGARPETPDWVNSTILMRKDPPFDTEYIYTTYILDRAGTQGALVCNRPQGLRDMNEKVYTAWFPECCAPTLITRDMHDMSEFLREHGKAVCKPLNGMVGRSKFVMEQGDKNRNVVFETLTGYGTRYAIVQRYLPEIVTAGD